MSTPRALFEVWEDTAGEWRWHLKGGNGEIQAQGEGYKKQGNAERGITAFKRNATIAPVKVLRRPKKT